jgi:hypothetical protein
LYYSADNTNLPPLPSKNIDVKSISKKTLCDIISLMNQVLELTIFL